MFNLNQQGFSFIEVLLTLSLLMFVLFAAMKMVWMAFAMNQAAWYETVAAAEISNMARLIALHPANLSQYIREWKQSVSQKLPEGEGIVILHAKDHLVRVYWRMLHSGVWYCSSQPQSNGACIQLQQNFKTP